MVEYSLIILAAITFSLLWPLAKRAARLGAEYMNWSKRAFGSDFSAFGAGFRTFQIFSAETAEGKEAEYIDEKLPQEREIIRALRAFLISLYILATIYFLYVSR
jgi:hypothetical protein